MVMDGVLSKTARRSLLMPGTVTNELGNYGHIDEKLVGCTLFGGVVDCTICLVCSECFGDTISVLTLQRHSFPFLSSKLQATKRKSKPL